MQYRFAARQAADMVGRQMGETHVLDEILAVTEIQGRHRIYLPSERSDILRLD